MIFKSAQFKIKNCALFIEPFTRRRRSWTKKNSNEIMLWENYNLASCISKPLLILLRASISGSEFIYHINVPVNIDKITIIDRKTSSLAPTVLALEFFEILFSKGCAALQRGFFALILV